MSENKDDNNARSHKWTGRRQGGDPADAGSYEYVRYCELCGMEDTCEDPLPPCPGRDVIDTVQAQQALAELKRRHKGEPGWEG